MRLVCIVRKPPKTVFLTSRRRLLQLLTLQEVPLQYYYYCGLPLQFYKTFYACLKEEIKIMVTYTYCKGTGFVLNQQKNIRLLSKSTNLAEMHTTLHRMQKHVHPTAIYLYFYALTKQF